MGCARFSDFAAWAVTFMLVTAVAGQAGAGEVWVTNMVSANVTVINPDTMVVVATIPADKGAHNVTLSHDGNLAFIANNRANNVTIIDAVGKKVLGTVPAGRKTHQVSVSPDGTLAVSSNSGTDFVTLIDVNAKQPIGEITIADGAKLVGALTRLAPELEPRDRVLVDPRRADLHVRILVAGVDVKLSNQVEQAEA